MLAALLMWVQSTAPAVPAAAEAPSAQEELVAAAQALAATPNYRFEYLARLKRVALATGAPEGGEPPTDEPAPAPASAPADDSAAGERAARERSDASFTVAFAAGEPLHFVGLTREFFRSDERFAIPHPKSGKWFAIDRDHGDLSQAPRGRGEIAQMLEQADAVVAPHLLLADLAAKVVDLQVEERNGERCFAGVLTETGLAQWCRGLDAIDRTGKVTPKPALDKVKVGARRGTLTVIVSAGAIREVSARLTLPIGRSRNAFEVERRCHLTDHGKTTLTVPAEVRSVLQIE